jgi:Fe-S oxidoreductase
LHPYESQLRSPNGYAFGRIDKWAQVASFAPAFANFFSQTPGFSYAIKSILGVAPQRQMPRFAPVSFQAWARKRRIPEPREQLLGRQAAVPERREVILWADTFNNYFRPEAARAALEVLEQAGFQVRVPMRHFCCGRPLYDFGMLDKAKKYLRGILQFFSRQIDSNVPVVVLEPSCASVFRDELHNLFPADERADRLRRQTFLLSEFLEPHAAGYQPPKLPRKILLHGHCHHKSLMKMSDEESLLRKMGADLQAIDSGCCGMAGPFGFEKKNFGVSQALGERVLLPSVRQAGPEVLIVTDGFSCREQILQATGRRAIHLAEAMQLALPPTGNKDSNNA